VYFDASALLKLYVREPETDEVGQIIAADAEVTTARLTLVEVRRNLARLLGGAQLTRARADFEADWESINVLEVDEWVCSRAAELGELMGVKSLDAVHVAAAERAGRAICTYDKRQARAARELGLTVVGAVD